ncbi:MAG: hypothetical protein WD873_00775 [Candidatus Hydrogenedentales bacterium]
MTYPWFTWALPTDKPTQGDIILGCPIVRLDDLIVDKDEFEATQTVIEQDVIVMTQACDLETDKVQNVVLCPIYFLVNLQKDWEAKRVSKSQSTHFKDWLGFLKEVKRGQRPNLAMTNRCTLPEIELAHGVIDFHEVFTLPKQVLLNYIGSLNGRPRLLPPYREYVSQAFARFFMRVGHPIDIDSW